MRLWRLAMIGLAVGLTAGCAVNFSKRSPWDIRQISELSDQLEQFKTLAQLKAEEADQLRRAKEMLEQQLSSSDAKIGYDERGVVARLLDQVLFDSGKATMRRGAGRVLDQVAPAVKQFPSQPVGVEGHSDNQPIKYSGWASNKALSEARAQAVADYLIQKHGIDPGRITVIGYGDERPVASNNASLGRQKNRRVEIVIMPNKELGQAYEREAARVHSGSPYSK